MIQQALSILRDSIYCRLAPAFALVLYLITSKMASRKHKNPMTNPLHYATPQLLTGPPATYASAQRKLPGYDFGEQFYFSLLIQSPFN